MARLRVVARLALDNPALPPFVIYSVAAHLLCAVALLSLPALRARRPALVNQLPVELVAAAPAPAPALRAPAPAPAPSKAPDVAPATQPPPKPDPLPANPKAEKKPQPKPPKKEPKTPEQKAPQAPSPDEKKVPASGPSGPTAAAPGPDGSVTALEGIDVEFAWYRASLTNLLYGSWRRPLLERVEQPYEVTVGFTILRDGRVTELRVEQSSGVPSMDRSALRAVSDAAPLPPLPSGWRGPVLSALFVFQLYPE